MSRPIFRGRKVRRSNMVLLDPPEDDFYNDNGDLFNILQNTLEDGNAKTRCIHIKRNGKQCNVIPRKGEKCSIHMPRISKRVEKEILEVKDDVKTQRGVHSLCSNSLFGREGAPGVYIVVSPPGGLTITHMNNTDIVQKQRTLLSYYSKMEKL